MSNLPHLGCFSKPQLSFTETRVGADVLWRIELMRGESACPILLAKQYYCSGV